MTEGVRIFDTTLRDGEQSPGVALSTQEKLAIAGQLARLGVDYLEAGFPQASQGDYESVRRIASAVQGPSIVALARCSRQDIEKAAKALENARDARIHVFIATSPIHMQAKLHMTPEEVLERIDTMVRLARTYMEDIEFSCEDATRSDSEFLIKAGKVAVEAGATTLNFPDTVGYTSPREYFQLISLIRAAIPDLAVTLSVHCHDDLGLAVANTLAGIEAGCRQVEVAVNGIGERAGNASLEEVVMNLTARADQYQVRHHIKTQEIYRASQMVSKLTGMAVQPNKAIVGKNAFRHEAGIHQDGMLKDRTTYEIMTPETVGWGLSKLVLGKHSGRHALRQRMDELGLSATPEQIDRIQNRVKELAELKNDVNDQDLEALWQEEVGQVRRSRSTELVDWQISTGSQNRPVAYVSVRRGQEIHEDSGSGDGPVHALFQAFARALGLTDVELTSYHLAPISPGEGGLASVQVEIRGYECETRGQAADSDVMKATAVALHEALSYLYERTQNVVA
jgi:2-isopropylmalate synthase